MAQFILVGVLALALLILLAAADQMRGGRSSQARGSSRSSGRSDGASGGAARSAARGEREKAAPSRSGGGSAPGSRSDAAGESRGGTIPGTLDFGNVVVSERHEDSWRPLLISETAPEILERFAATLPEPSMVTSRMAGALDDPNANPRKIARIASSDPLLAAKILTAVNSPLFGLPKKTADLNRAVIMLGYSQIKRIVYRLLVTQSFKSSHGTDLQQDDLWEHSFLVSTIAPPLANLAGVGAAGTLATAGLLLDVGKMALLRNDPETAARIYGNGLTDDRATCRAEEEAFGVNHGVAGGLLARKWNLPPEIAAMIELHVQPHFVASPIVPENSMKALCVLHLAEVLVRDWRSWRATGFTDDPSVMSLEIPPEPDPFFFDLLGFEPALASLQTPAIDRALEEGTEFIASLAAARQARPARWRDRPAAAATA